MGGALEARSRSVCNWAPALDRLAGEPRFHPGTGARTEYPNYVEDGAHRYAAAGLDDDDAVERFARSFGSAVLAGHRAAVASMLGSLSR